MTNTNLTAVASPKAIAAIREAREEGFALRFYTYPNSDVIATYLQGSDAKVYIYANGDVDVVIAEYPWV